MIPDPTPVRRLVIVMDVRGSSEWTNARDAAEWQLTAAGEYSIDGELAGAGWADSIEGKISEYIRCTTLPESVADRVASGVMQILAEESDHASG